MMQSKTSFKNLLCLTNIAMIFIPLLLMTVMTFYILTNSLRDEITNKNLTLSRSIAGEIDRFLNAPLNELQQLKYTLEKGQSTGSPSINSHLESIVQNHNYFSMIMITDDKGSVTSAYPHNQDYIGLDLSAQQFYKEAKNTNSAYWSHVSISIKTGHPTTVLAIPFDQGIITGYLDLSALNEITEKIKIGDNGYSIVVDQTGTIIAHKNPQLVKEQLNIKNLDFIQKALSGQEGIFKYQFMDIESLGSVSFVQKPRWIVVVTQPIEEAFAPVNKITVFLIAGLIAAILFAISVSLIISRRFSQPLSGLKQRTKMIADGDYSSPIRSAEFDAYSEINELAQNFNKMAEAVKNREESLRFAQFSIDNASEAVFWGDSGGRFLYANKAACRLLSYNMEDLTQKHVYDIDANLKTEAFQPAFNNLRKYGLMRFETIYKTALGKTIPVDITSSILNYNEKEYFFAFARDISVRKQVEKTLAEEKELLSVTLRSIGEGVITTDIEGRVVLMNRMAESITGLKQIELTGLPIYDFFHIYDIETKESCNNRITDVMNIDRTSGYSGKNILSAKDGSEKIISLSAVPLKDMESRAIGVVLAFRDITEQTRMEEEILKADKLESLGLLAGGIAHDFNNLLTAILGNIGLTKIFLGPDDKAVTRLQAAEKAIERAKDLTQQLLTFSRGGAPVKIVSSIEQIVIDSASFSLRGSNVKCEFSIDDGILPVEVDEGQMSRVINNLIINACHAMPDGGVINIEIKNVIIGKADNLPINDGKYICLTVKDHGVGIPEENLNKIFDPYFTTKAKGIGLGLAAAYSIIKNHNGYITVHSKVNEGTTFQIFLPASEQKLSKAASETEEYALKGSGKILIMDDEEIIRLVAKELLKHLGYTVVLSKDGEEALQLYKNAKQEGNPFDAVIMDLTIPGAMGGRELMSFLLQYDPGVKAIVSSGYSNDPIMAFYKDFGFSGVVSKPYKIKEFSEVLHNVLNSETG